MVVTDPIADFLTRIRNAIMVRHDQLEMPTSKMKASIAEILKKEGFIRDYELVDDSALRIHLHYGGDKKEPAMAGLKRVSHPGLRVYVQKGEIPRYYGGLGVAILSTSRGVMTGNQAWREGIGGELLCYVW
jgi:small subunit ribosomal protein S8